MQNKPQIRKRTKKQRKYTYLPYDSDQSFELVSPSQVPPQMLIKNQQLMEIEVKEESEDETQSGCKYCRKSLPRLEKIITQLLLQKFESRDVMPIGQEKINEIHLLNDEEKDYYLIEFENETCEAIGKKDLLKEQLRKIATFMEDRLWH